MDRDTSCSVHCNKIQGQPEPRGPHLQTKYLVAHHWVASAASPPAESGITLRLGGVGRRGLGLHLGAQSWAFHHERSTWQSLQASAPRPALTDRALGLTRYWAGPCARWGCSHSGTCHHQTLACTPGTWWDLVSVGPRCDPAWRQFRYLGGLPLSPSSKLGQQKGTVCEDSVLT